MSQQVNVILADDTAALIESVPLAERDRFIDTVIRRSAPVWLDEDLHRLLQEGAIARAERDRAFAKAWNWEENAVSHR